ncbi:MAG TPA: YetF domain-containing protein [Candidatus Saccharimonadales bacterium]|nr:YetF domain-containing protein [Candidatus Saccharimonadales bacterium]
MAFLAICRAAFGYLFLVLIVRIVGRRPGKQLTPFEYVLVFYLGGLTLTGMVGADMSMTNSICQIITVAACHYLLCWLRLRSDWAARVLDGTPLVLLYNRRWRTRTMSRVRIQDDDVMDMAREQGIRDLDGIHGAILETTGSITILAAHNEAGQTDDIPEQRG